MSLRCCESNSGNWTESSNGQIAKDKAEVVGKEGHECQGKALNLILNSLKGFKPEAGIFQFWI